MNLYEILGVAKSADVVTIRRQYQSLAQQHHPDKGGDPKKFAQIQEAYEILRDPQRRKIYDETGQTRKENTIEQMAVAELMTCFDVWLQHLMNGQRSVNDDCLMFMSRTFSSAIQRAEQEIAKVSANLKILEKIQNKFKGGESSLMNGHINSRLEAAKNHQKNVQKNVQVLAAARDLLKEIEYDHELGLTFGGTTTVTGGTTWT